MGNKIKAPSFFWCQICKRDLIKEDGSIVIYKPIGFGLTTGFSSNICSEKCYNKMFHEKNKKKEYLLPLDYCVLLSIVILFVIYWMFVMYKIL